MNLIFVLQRKTNIVQNWILPGMGDAYNRILLPAWQRDSDHRRLVLILKQTTSHYILDSSFCQNVAVSLSQNTYRSKLESTA